MYTHTPHDCGAARPSSFGGNPIAKAGERCTKAPERNSHKPAGTAVGSGLEPQWLPIATAAIRTACPHDNAMHEVSYPKENPIERRCYAC